MKNVYRNIGMWLIIISLGICLGCAQAEETKTCTGNSCNENPDQIDTDGDGVPDIKDCARTDPDRFNKVDYRVDKNENSLPVPTPGNPDGISFSMCVGNTVQDYPCFTRNSGPWDTAEIPTARCGGNQPLPTGTLACVANGNTVTLTVNNVTGIVTNANFMEGVSTVGSDNTEPYSLVLSNVTDGNHTYFTTLIGPNGNANTNSCSVTAGGNVGNPVVTIIVPVANANVTLNVAFTALATVAYAYPISNLTFTVGNNTTPTCTDTSAPYECVITPSALGNLTVTVTAHAANGHTGSATVTVNVVNATPMDVLSLRCTYHFAHDYYQYNGSTCVITQDGSTEPWQNNVPTICGQAGNPCIFEGVIREEVFNGDTLPGTCEFQSNVPSGSHGNPNPSFISSRGWPEDWALIGWPEDGNSLFEDFMTPNSLVCNLYRNDVWVGRIPTSYILHTWGANYLLNFAGVTNQAGNRVNVFIGTYVDWDGDNYPNYCPANVAGCIPDNCIAYTNPDQLPSSIPGVGAACIGHPNPSENDSDNDGYLDGEDAYPFDRTRF